MLGFNRRSGIETTVNLIVGHLDGGLDVIDGLLGRTFRPEAVTQAMTSTEILDELERLRGFVEDIRDQEFALIAKLRQCLQWSGRLDRLDKTCAGAARLYRLGVQPLMDALPQISDRTSEVFDTADDTYSFLASRGLVGPDCLSLDGIAELTVNEDFLVCGLARLGDLQQLSEVYASAIEVEFAIHLATEEPARSGALAASGRETEPVDEVSAEVGGSKTDAQAGSAPTGDDSDDASAPDCAPFEADAAATDGDPAAEPLSGEPPLPGDQPAGADAVAEGAGQDRGFAEDIGRALDELLRESELADIVPDDGEEGEDGENPGEHADIAAPLPVMASVGDAKTENAAGSRGQNI